MAQAAPSLGEIIGIVEQTYRAEAESPAQIPAKVAVHSGKGFMHAMPGWIGDAVGVKWVSYFHGNRGAPDSSALIVLNDAATGQPQAIMEGMWITYARTSACAAVMAKHLARPRPTRLGMVGCGGLAEWSLRALTEVFPSIELVRVASLRAGSRRAFCAKMTGPWRIEPVDSVRAAVEEMDIVLSTTPKLETHPIAGEWWSAGSVLIPLDVTGAWDDACYARADRLVDDGAANLANALARYRPNLARDPAREIRTVALQEIVAGRVPGRRSDAERILAFVTGIVSTDLTVAGTILRRAIERGIGTSLTLD